jgi:hypothetical protein
MKLRSERSRISKNRNFEIILYIADLKKLAI